MATYFNTALCEFADKFILRHVRATNFEEVNVKFYYEKLWADLFEQLLLYDTVYIKHERNNMPMAMLLDKFGNEFVSQAIQEGAIVPVLWTSQLFTFSGNEEEHQRKKTPPVVGALLSSPQHSKPYDSLKETFSYLPGIYSEEEITKFISEVENKFLIPDTISSYKTSEIVISAYESNYLEAIGMPFEKESHLLNLSERSKLLNLSSEILITSFAAQNDVFLLETPSQFVLAHAGLKSCGNAMKLREKFEVIQKEESIPVLTSLYNDNIIDFNGILKLRRSNDALRFRSWISYSETDKEKILSDYINKIYSKAGVFESGKMKFLKFMLMQTVGLGVGEFMKNTTAGVITGVGLNAFDSYILDGVKKGWSPKSYVEEIKSTIEKYQE